MQILATLDPHTLLYIFLPALLFESAQVSVGAALRWVVVVACRPLQAASREAARTHHAIAEAFTWYRLLVSHMMPRFNRVCAPSGD